MQKIHEILMFPVFWGIFISLRNNNITDEGVRKLIAKGIQCDKFQKIA